jgi:acetolactate synthase small subunit
MQSIHGIFLRGLNTPSLLSRISLTLSRRRLNVKQLRMQSSEDGRFASYQIILACEQPTAERLQRQLCRTVEISEVSLYDGFKSLESDERKSSGCNDSVRADDSREGNSLEILKAV